MKFNLNLSQICNRRTPKFAFPKFSRILQKKSAGVSLLNAIFISTLLMGIVVSMIHFASRNLDMISGMQRNNQMFFASESGIEAAFFHHNARGQGVNFGELGSDSSQIIDHKETNINTKWTIKGRAEGYAGILKEGESVEIPLFYDSASDPNTSVNKTQLTASGVSVKFSRNLFESNGDTGNTEIVPYGFGFSTATSNTAENTEEKPLINYSISRKDSSGELKTFEPRADDINNPCANPTGFFCVDDLSFSEEATLFEATTIGYIRPGETEDNKKQYSEFYNESNSDYRISFNALLKMQQGENKIAGIPYYITNNNTEEIPLPYYTAKVSASSKDFARNYEISVKERTSGSSFDYTILD